MTTPIKNIKSAMLLAVAMIDKADECEAFFSSFDDSTSKQMISDGHQAAAKAIAKVIDAIVEAADTGGIDVLTKQNQITGNKTHSVIIAPTLERHG